MNKLSMLVVAAGIFLFPGFTEKSVAGCWVVTQGIHSYLKCDSAGAVPTFESFQQSLNQIGGLSSECKRATLNYAGSNLSCAFAILTAIKTGGATVWVGAGEACYEFSEQMENASDACRSYVNLRTKPIQTTICNQRRERLALAVARRDIHGRKLASGWFDLQPGKCNQFSYPDTRVIYALGVTPERQKLYPHYPGNHVDNEATFCIDKRGGFNDLDVRVCHDHEEHRPHDFNAPGNLKFTNFGRVSGLPGGGFTFR